MRRPKEPFLIALAVVGAVLLLFIALPLVTTVVSQDASGLAAALGDSEVRNAIAVSFGAALVATAIACVLGVPLAYVLARKEFPGKSVVQSIVDLPVVVPHTVAGIALLTVFGRAGVFSGGMDALNLAFEDHFLGIVAAMVFVSASFVVNSAREGFERVDERLEFVARTLGATRSRAFVSVTVPLSASSLVTGAVMAWARAVSEFGAVVIIAAFPKVIPTLIYEKNLYSGLAESMPVAAVLLLLCVGIFVAFRTLVAMWKRASERSQ